MKKKRIWIFLVITFVLTYALELFFIYPLYRQGTPQAAKTIGLLKTAAMFLPALGVILTCLFTRDFKGIWIRPNGKKSVKYFFAAYFLPSVFTIAGAAVYFLVFSGEFDRNLGYLRMALFSSGVQVTDEIARNVMISNLAAGILLSGILNFIPALGEELGWRGYLLPKLLERFSAVWAILINGVIWGLWHAPLIAMGHNYGFGYLGYPAAGILAMCLSSIVLGAFLSYVTIRTKSCLPAAVGHGAYNGIAAVGLIFTDGTGRVNPFVGPMPLGIVGGSVFLIAAIVILIRLQRNGQRKERVAK